jgi:hypothetical protein
MDQVRKKSPRAPSIPLDEALERSLNAYDKERLHPAPADVVAQNIGYKSANSGTALQALASLRYYGLLERPKEGLLAVSRDVESYRFAPDDQLRKRLLLKFLKSPPLFADLLDKFGINLPSDSNLKHELITQRGFTPGSADIVLNVFRRSVAFAGYEGNGDDSVAAQTENEKVSEAETSSPNIRVGVAASRAQSDAVDPLESVSRDFDKIPVRLRGNRRAWLVIPVPFFEEDKNRLKSQIDLILADEPGE